jgi:2-isopropylmalate synthase
MTVVIYDTTLRDGTQGEGIQLSVADKLQVAQLIDELGISYIEGGWPGSNPRDEAFFTEAKKLKLVDARLTAFGATRRAGLPCEEDPNLQALLRAEVPVLTIFGKSWRLHVREALRITDEQNLELIEDSVRYLKSRVEEVIYDAEHFFDGYKDDPDYAIASLRAAVAGGADYLALCDTNGGGLPHEVEQAIADVARAVPDVKLGIHTHNDSELAVANALAAVRTGAQMVQGTINGFGERCGNANLISIIPTLALKMKVPVVTEAQLARLRHVARTVDEISNRVPWSQQPYVGRSAFAHKGGVHVDAVKKNAQTYEHIDPARVGNSRRVLLSDLSGRANVELKAKELGMTLDPSSPEARRVLARLKQLEADGYEFESAGASFKLLVMQCVAERPAYLALRDLEVTIAFGDGEHGQADAGVTRARLEIGVGDEVAYTSA